MVSSPLSIPSTPPTFTSPVNSLVMAGLIPEDLSDIFLTPQDNAAVSKRREKRITGARNLTADDYFKMLVDDEEKKKEEMKKKKEEREQKKKEREQGKEKKKQEVQERKRKREIEKQKKGKGKGKRRCRQLSSSESDDPPLLSEDSEESAEEPAEEPGSRSQRQRRTNPEVYGEQSDSRQRQRRAQLPARFRNDSDGDDGVLCSICNATEPVGMASSTVFWVYCDKCGTWVHNYCVFKKNNVSRRFTCMQ